MLKEGALDELAVKGLLKLPGFTKGFEEGSELNAVEVEEVEGAYETSIESQNAVGVI